MANPGGHVRFTPESGNQVGGALGQFRTRAPQQKGAELS